MIEKYGVFVNLHLSLWVSGFSFFLFLTVSGGCLTLRVIYSHSFVTKITYL